MGKNVADVVVGMLSDVGSATRPPTREANTGAPTSSTQGTSPARPPASLSSELSDAPRPPVHQPDARNVASSSATAAPNASRSDGPREVVAPRTLRLRPQTASELREAWLSAKREDVLLTAQDFASDLVEEALRLRRRRHRVANTT